MANNRRKKKKGRVKTGALRRTVIMPGLAARLGDETESVVSGLVSRSLARIKRPRGESRYRMLFGPALEPSVVVVRFDRRTREAVVGLAAEFDAEYRPFPRDHLVQPPQFTDAEWEEAARHLSRDHGRRETDGSASQSGQRT